MWSMSAGPREASAAGRRHKRRELVWMRQRRRMVAVDLLLPGRVLRPERLRGGRDHPVAAGDDVGARHVEPRAALSGAVKAPTCSGVSRAVAALIRSGAQSANRTCAPAGCRTPNYERPPLTRWGRVAERRSSVMRGRVPRFFAGTRRSSSGDRLMSPRHAGQHKQLRTARVTVVK